MNIRLVDPATWTVVRKYRNVLEACAAPAGESEGLIWAEADDDDAAVLQARAKVGAATLREAAEGIAKPAPPAPEAIPALYRWRLVLNVAAASRAETIACLRALADRIEREGSVGGAAVNPGRWMARHELTAEGGEG